MEEVNLCVCLDVGTGTYWFYPSWPPYPPTLESLEIDRLAPVQGRLTIIEPFILPGDVGTADGLRYWSALIKGTDLIGELTGYDFAFVD